MVAVAHGELALSDTDFEGVDAAMVNWGVDELVELVTLATHFCADNFVMFRDLS